MNEDSECPNVAVLIVPLCIQSKTMSWWILGTRVEMVRCDGRIGISLHR